MSEWRPIETAPRDNPRCLVYSPNNDDIRIIPAFLIKTVCDATHWMPLPEPPDELATACDLSAKGGDDSPEVAT